MTNTEPVTVERSGNAILRLRFLVDEMFQIVLFLAIFFISSGRLDWVPGWAVFVLGLICLTFVSLAVSPSLIKERSLQVGKKEGSKKWDLAILCGLAAFYFIAAIVAGLDIRFSWSGSIPAFISVAASALFVVGYALFYGAMISNQFFSNVVRIQGDRGHAVVESGPYHFIRHPGYLGMIVSLLATPLILGSLWALAPMIVCALLLVVRTGFEDKTLKDGLPGYKEYAQRTRYRLVPGIW